MAEREMEKKWKEGQDTERGKGKKTQREGGDISGRTEGAGREIGGGGKTWQEGRSLNDLTFIFSGQIRSDCHREQHTLYV